MKHSFFKKAFLFAIICACLLLCSGCTDNKKFVCTSCGEEHTGKKYESSYTLKDDEKIVLCQSCYDMLLRLTGNTSMPTPTHTPKPTTKPTRTPKSTSTPVPTPTPTPVPLNVENLVGYWSNGRFLFNSNGKAVIDGYNGTYDIDKQHIVFHYYDPGMDTMEVMLFYWENNGALTDSSGHITYQKDNTPFEEEKYTPTPTEQPTTANSLEHIASDPWEESDDVSLVTHQMRYVNQFFNEDGSLTQMGLDLYKWLDMSKRDTVERIDSGYLMLEEEYLYHQDTLFQGGFVTAANKSLETISSVGINLGLDFANHQLMKAKFGDAGAYAVPYYEQLSEIYLEFLQGLEQEMAMMDVALSAITDAIGKGVNITLVDSVDAAIYVMQETDFWRSLTYSQRESIINVRNAMIGRKLLPTSSYKERLNAQKYQNFVDKVGISFDFATSAASWYEVFTTNDNLTIQQQMYMAAFNKVTDEHLDVLLELRENLHKNSSLTKSELKNIDGAIGALICDIYVARNNHMNAAARADWNTKLSTYKPLCNAIYSTAEFGVTLGGVKDIMSIKTAAQGFAGVTAVAGVGSFILSMTTQDFLDIREQTKVIYNLKKAITESLELQLSNYAANPSHEQAVAIISSLKLLKQTKRTGEEAVSMFYIAREADAFGLENAPAAQAILWNELITCNALGGYNLDAESYIKSIWTVYENSIKYENILNDVICCHIESEPVAYYRYDKDVSYQGSLLESLSSSLKTTIESGEWKPTDHYIRYAFVQPLATGVQWSNRTFASQSENLMNQNELEKQIKNVSNSRFQQISREKEYVYSRGNVEVRISVDEFEKYLAAEKEVEQLMNAYKDTSALEYADHQAEERLIWTKVTNGYIESFPMYDPFENYEEAVQTPVITPTLTITPVPTPSWSTSVDSFHYKKASASESGNGRIELQIGAEYFDKVITVSALCHAYMSMDPPSDESYPYFYFIAPHSGDYAISAKPNGVGYRLSFYTANESDKLKRIASLNLNIAREVQTEILSDIPAGTKIYLKCQNDAMPTINTSVALEMKITPME